MALCPVNIPIYLVLTLVTIGAVIADVSHLSDGYNYDRHTLNIPVSLEHNHIQHEAPIQEYLPPVQEHHHHHQHEEQHQHHHQHFSTPESESEFQPLVQDFHAPSSDYLPPTEEYHISSNEYVPPAQEYHAPSNEYLPPTQEYSAPGPIEDYHAPAVISHQHEHIHHIPSVPITEYLPPSHELHAPVSAPLHDYIPPVHEQHHHHHEHHEHHDSAAIQEYNSPDVYTAPATQTGGYHYNNPFKRHRRRI
ncbi:histidine-rich glycoprotein-like [Teleopsis dalmanni]|uniref:histidine-rich glycoprotein-like n=1 Tax=Teleopsis dalmanni TaxID=139649 RepID=UPI0018CDE677|nr:histidine-rich glycoprotein-like [Teleopsis dalmanni]